MNFAAFSRPVGIALVCLCLCVASYGQGIQVDLEEFRRLQGEVADLRDANAAFQRRITELTRRIDKLQEDLRQANERNTLRMGDYVTREDLKKIVDRIAEVDEKREADRKVILQEFEKLGRTLSSASSGNSRPDRRPEPDKPAVIEGTFYPYKVKEGEYLGGIIQAYNEALKGEGRPPITMQQVRNANPGLNPSRIFVGQEILLPVPDKKR